MVSGETRIPAEALITSSLDDDAVASSSDLPFAHSVTRIPSSSSRSMHIAASYTLERYLTMLRITGLHKEGARNTQVNNPYNLLTTREWMLLVPRREECFESISINSLGFAGALLVRSDRQMQILRNAGPMKLLQHVAKMR
jgi:ATP adenylyltransferase